MDLTWFFVEDRKSSWSMWLLDNNQLCYWLAGVNLTVQDLLHQDARIEDFHFNISEMKSYQSHRCILYLMPLSMTPFWLKTAMWLTASFQRYWSTNRRSFSPWLGNPRPYYLHRFCELGWSKFRQIKKSHHQIRDDLPSTLNKNIHYFSITQINKL